MNAELKTKIDAALAREIKAGNNLISHTPDLAQAALQAIKDADGNYKMPTLYDISGSANWYNKADLGVIVHRENEDDTIIKVQKSRYHETIGRPGEVRMQFSKDEKRFIESGRGALI